MAVASGLCGGCDGGRKSTANDALRRQVLELEQENEQLRRRQAELTTELYQASQRLESLPPEVRENTPRVAEITISRLSHARDEDDDGVPDLIRLYINPVDGYGRFVQMVGTVSIHAVSLPSDGDAITINRLTLTPTELRAAYRSGVTGTHYTIDLPLENTSELKEDSLLLRVLYEDGHTGRQRTAERDIQLRR